MSATLKLTHKTIGVEVRRGTYDVVVDGKRAGSLELNETIDTPVESGRHTLQVRTGRREGSLPARGHVACRGSTHDACPACGYAASRLSSVEALHTGIGKGE